VSRFRGETQGRGRGEGERKGRGRGEGERKGRVAGGWQGDAGSVGTGCEAQGAWYINSLLISLTYYLVSLDR